MWLSDPAATGLRRPDRVHYVIDSADDMVHIQHEEGGAREPMSAMQIWCDPAFPDAHRDPALRRYIEAAQVYALVRYDSVRAIVLIPPSLSNDGRWHEQRPQLNNDLPGNIQVLRAAGYA